MGKLTLSLSAMLMARTLWGVDVEKVGGEFRPVELEHTPHICAAPVLMLMLWRNSFDLCGVQEMNPETYLDIHTDLLVRGLLK